MSRELVKEMLREKGLPSINFRVSNFTRRDVEALKVSFQSVTCNNQIIPPVDVSKDFPEQYVQPDIHHEELEKRSFDIRKIGGIPDDVRTFILKLHWVVKNATVITGTDETYTDTLVDDLLRIAGLNTFPLAIRNHQECRLFIGGYPYLSADPEFSIKMVDTSMIAVEDKHLQNIGLSKGFGEWQIVAEILACGDENMQLGEGLPQEQSVVILRWPGENIPEAGLNIAGPEGRREVLEILVRIRQDLIASGN
ncbi:hypothetical protein Glove_205g44 [Diversispora epigaea]|uniref:Uncharacterized protein n=1 Tax=Diversispora epigaea TaxID=1348612 RepID=A0A397IMN3_9GLOM|nr:hypothetical protein Glove_205g44 [Diversispora epigaea]